MTEPTGAAPADRDRRRHRQDRPRPSPGRARHGFGDTGETAWWRRLRRHLRADGYDDGDLWTVSFGDRLLEANESPRPYGEEIAATLEGLHDDRGCAVDVVAHSMGGLGSRWAIEQEGAAPSARSPLTLGTPHQGTRAAHLARRSPGGRDMVPGSDLLETLNDGPGPSDVRYNAVWGQPGPADRRAAPGGAPRRGDGRPRREPGGGPGRASRPHGRPGRLPGVARPPPG